MNEIAHVPESIAAHQKKVAALEQEPAETKAAPERLQQEGLDLEGAFRAGDDVSENLTELALLTQLRRPGQSS
ncbi:hypothetical protein [Arthrobacter globiformis]|uniref:hypothetical protein n=1 Tax=Arthrobacter globiformis TaxID=1665 RepID=UPI00397CC33D